MKEDLLVTMSSSPTLSKVLSSSSSSKDDTYSCIPNNLVLLQQAHTDVVVTPLTENEHSSSHPSVNSNNKKLLEYESKQSSGSSSSEHKADENEPDIMAMLLLPETIWIQPLPHPYTQLCFHKKKGVAAVMVDGQRRRDVNDDASLNSMTMMTDEYTAPGLQQSSSSSSSSFSSSSSVDSASSFPTGWSTSSSESASSPSSSSRSSSSCSGDDITESSHISKSRTRTSTSNGCPTTTTSNSSSKNENDEIWLTHQSFFWLDRDWYLENDDAYDEETHIHLLHDVAVCEHVLTVNYSGTAVSFWSYLLQRLGACQSMRGRRYHHQQQHHQTTRGRSASTMVQRVHLNNKDSITSASWYAYAPLHIE